MKRFAVIIATGVIAMACSSAAQAPSQESPQQLRGSITIFAAGSLSDSFPALADAFERQHGGVSSQISFSGTPELVTQIEQGAPADVFASADTTNMDKLRSDGFTAATPRVFAHNRLEIAVAPGNPKGIRTLQDLARSDVIYISGGPTVPIGKYAAQALTKAGVTAVPKSLETDVKAVISKIELGEADAGIVYTTDVKAAGDKVLGIPIPDQDNVVATYPIVIVKASRNFGISEAFIDFIVSPEGQAELETFGFLPA